MLGKRVYASSWATQPWKKRKIYPLKSKSKLSRLTKAVRAIKRTQELKYFDSSLVSATAGLVSPINNIPLGDDISTRDGRKVMMKKVEVNIVTSVTAGGATPAPRYCIVYDKANNGVLPVIGSIFNASTTGAMPIIENEKRFKILYDNYGGYGRGRDPIQGFVAGETYTFIDQMKMPLNHETRFDATGSGTIAGTLTGALYLVFLGGAGTTSAEIRARVHYYDS